MSVFVGDRPRASPRLGIDLLASLGELVDAVTPTVLLDLRGDMFGLDELVLSARVLLLPTFATGERPVCGLRGEEVDWAERAEETEVFDGSAPGDRVLCTDKLDLDALARSTDRLSSSLDEADSSLTAGDNS
jgi:hypothetical protein